MVAPAAGAVSGAGGALLGFGSSPHYISLNAIVSDGPLGDACWLRVLLFLLLWVLLISSSMHDLSVLEVALVLCFCLSHGPHRHSLRMVPIVQCLQRYLSSDTILNHDETSQVVSSSSQDRHFCILDRPHESFSCWVSSSAGL